MRRLPLALLVTLLLGACGGGGGEEQGMTPADSVAMAMEQYSPALFDTITWSADSAQFNRGRIVWAYSCKKCHGEQGLGDGDEVTSGDTIKPPNFATGWRFGSDRSAVIKAIFAGTAEGMPHWGMSGLKPRDIDAVTAYILKNLVGISDMTVQTPTDTMP